MLFFLQPITLWQKDYSDPERDEEEIEDHMEKKKRKENITTNNEVIGCLHPSMNYIHNNNF